MAGISLVIPESQVVKWVQELSPEAKHAVLRLLIPQLDEMDRVIKHGNRRLRELCRARGLEWDELSEAQRERLIDDILHEA